MFWTELVSAVFILNLPLTALTSHNTPQRNNSTCHLFLSHYVPQWSSDSEGSAQSSVGAGSQPGKGFVGVHSMDSHVSNLLQKTIQKPLDSNVLLYTTEQRDLEARVHQIALREGFSPPSLTSISIATARRTPSPLLSPSDCPVTGTVELGNVDARRHSGHQKGTDTNLEVAYPQLRHQPGEIPNASDGEEQLDSGGKSKEWTEEIKYDDKENNGINDPHIVREMSHVDYNITGSNQIVSSVASDTASANTSHLSHIHLTLSPRPKHQSHSVEYHSSRSSQNSSKDVLPPTGIEQQRFNSISNQSRSFEYKEPVQVQNEKRVSPHLQARYPRAFTSAQRMKGTSRTLAVQAAGE